MKILHVNGARGYGGNEQQLLDIASKLSELKVNNAVFCALNSELSTRLKPYPGIEVFTAVDKKFKNVVNRKEFKRVIAQFKPDLVHLHTSNALTLYFFTAVLSSLDIPVVFSKKGMSSSMSFLSKYKYNYKGIDAIICVSQTVKEAMQRVVMFEKNYNKLLVVPDGVDEERPMILQDSSAVLESNEKSVQIGNVANHDDRKDLPTLVRAIDHLVNGLNYTDFKVHQIGMFRDKQSPEIVALIKELNLGSYIKLYGFVEEAARAYEEMDIFLMTSKHEGGPSSLLEAMRFKKAVVSTRVGVVPDAVVNNETGFIVAPKDYKALAEKLLILCQDKNLRDQYGEASYIHFAKNFTAQQSARKTLDIYKKVLEV